MSIKSKSSLKPEREIYKLRLHLDNRQRHKMDYVTAGPSSKKRRVLQTIITTQIPESRTSRSLRRISVEYSPASSQMSEPPFSIDYSPRSKFLRNLKENGRVIKKSPHSNKKSHPYSALSARTNESSVTCRRSCKSKTSPSKTHRTTKDTGTDPPSFRSPRTKDIGTDPPSFVDKKTLDKETQQSTSTNGSKSCPQGNTQNRHAESAMIQKARDAITQALQNFEKNAPVGPNVIANLRENERQGKDTMDCPREALQELRDFRLTHWFDCHAPNKYVTLPNHSCSHQYVLGERMLPQPIKKDCEGRSLCKKCGLPAFAAKSSTHEIVMNSASNPKKKVTFDIADPYASKPILRSTVESRNKISIATVPTQSYIPHVRQKQGKFLGTKICPPEVENSKKVRHTINNCKVCIRT